MLSFFNNARYLSGNSANPILNNNLLNILLTKRDWTQDKTSHFSYSNGTQAK
ncbi:hypothetical protein VCRA2128O305_370019 [Vibrio crassostreae]|nr:hypothetical protein VCRA2112O187_140053 [Vibrio crassostreae]CAK1924371.1 hypothetical protein VCRA2112E186_230042 [Vibrio crassostreae]CAK1925614.1 hypothetical protein VCRA2112O185_220053 [Vibrio crassostreae]CAK1930924.1 hypothetical protein VCRA2118O239_240019 [Vibrio crassostreae]CAK1935738.1 hypothetical protein VCRA2119O245_260042 [Vibrio crassostreae]